MSRWILLSLLVLTSPAFAAKSKKKKSRSVEVHAEQVEGDEAFASRAGLGLGLGSPEVLTFEGYFQLSPAWRVRTLLAPKTLSYDVPLELGAFERELTLLTFASEAKSLTATVDYGPHFAVDGVFFASKRFYLLGGMGIRRITASINDGIPFRVCRATNTDCGSTSASNLQVIGKATSISTLLRTGLGWEWTLGESGFFNVLALGISVPVSRRLESSIDVQLDASRPSWFTSLINAALNTAVDRYEEEIAQTLYEAYGEDYDSIPLPLMGVSAGMFF